MRTRASGMWSRSPSCAKTAGKQVKSSTTARISHTWFASHTGPIASATRAPCSRARGPRASRSHTPPPKSAPASNTYALSDTTTIPASRSASVISRFPLPASRLAHGPHEPPDTLRHVRAAHDLTVQQPRHDRAEKAVEQREHDERHDEPRHRRHRVPGAHHAVNHPGLAPELGRHPSG